MPATPDFNENACTCVCSKSDKTCTERKFPKFNASTCDCKCELTPADCIKAAYPYFDINTCSCVCNKSAASCTGTTPIFDKKTCSCFCEKSETQCYLDAHSGSETDGNPLTAHVKSTSKRGPAKEKFNKNTC